MTIKDKIKEFDKRIAKLEKKRRDKKITEDEKRQLQSLTSKKRNLEEIHFVSLRLGDPIIAVICNYFYIPKGRSFKTYVSFQELITYKAQQQHRSDDKVFKQYISFIDTLQDKLKLYYPFINFEGIDLSWTTDQLIEFVVDAYFTRPMCTVEEIVEAREKEDTDFLSEEIIRKLNVKK